MDVAEVSLVVVSVWVISAFSAVVFGRWLETASDEAGGPGDVAGARPVTSGAIKPMRPMSRRDRWVPAGAAPSRTVQRLRRCQRRPYEFNRSKAGALAGGAPPLSHEDCPADSP